MSFRPSLGEHSIIPLPSSSSPSFLRFTYTPTSPPGDSIPQIWTSLPSSQWQAIPFSPSAEAEHGGKQTWLARIPLFGAQAGRFEYTFRLLHADGSFEWLGSEGGNGVVELVVPPSTSTSTSAAECPIEFGETEKVELEKKGWSSILAAFGVGEGRSDEVESFRLRTREEGGWEEAKGLVIERSE